MKDRLAIPLPRIIRVRNGTDFKVKWCDTCGTYRPPRSSHCRVCDNCVENIGGRRLRRDKCLPTDLYSADHHCTYLNTCIGRRNYFSFFAFLLTALLACFLSIAFSVLHIYYLTRPLSYALPRGGFGQGKDFGQALKATPLSAVIFLLSIAVVLPVMVLFGYHVRLVCINRTTVEQVRGLQTRGCVSPLLTGSLFRSASMLPALIARSPATTTMSTRAPLRIQNGLASILESQERIRTPSPIAPSFGT